MTKSPTTLLMVDRPNPGVFDFRAVAASLASEFPGFRVSSWDSFERQRTVMLDRVEQLMRECERFTKPEIIVNSFERKREALGPGIDVEFLQAGQVVVEGHIWRQSMTLRSRLVPADPLIQHLAIWLNENVAPTRVAQVE